MAGDESPLDLGDDGVLEPDHAAGSARPGRGGPAGCADSALTGGRRRRCRGARRGSWGRGRGSARGWVAGASVTSPRYDGLAICRPSDDAATQPCSRCWSRCDRLRRSPPSFSMSLRAVRTSRPPPRCSRTSSGTPPLHHSRGLADRSAARWLKCENLQRTGSFKIRGAYTRISRLTDEERARGWWPPAPATTRRGSRWPHGCSGEGDGLHARDRAAAQGGRDPRLRRGDPAARAVADRAAAAAAEYAEATGSVFIHPFDHPT